MMTHHALLILCLMLLVSAQTGFAQSAQQRDIEALIQELDYLIDNAQTLKKTYRSDRSSIRFNYAALIDQLRVTRNRAAQYLHEELTEVHPAPPRTVDTSLVRTR